MQSKFVQLKSDAELFLNSTVLSTRPYAVKYGPFPLTFKVICPQQKCNNRTPIHSSKSVLDLKQGIGGLARLSQDIPKNVVWDHIYRLDYGQSPLDGRLELKSGFLGKISHKRSRSSQESGSLTQRELSTQSSLRQ